MARSLFTGASIERWRSILSAGSRALTASSPLKRPWSINKVHFSVQAHLNTPVPKIRVKKDRPLDHVAEQEKDIAPLLRIKNTFLLFKKEAIPLRYLTIRRRNLGLRTTEERFEEFMRSYPTLFEIYSHPDEQLPWLKLTPEAKELVEQERLIQAEQEPRIVDRLRRLLMLAHDQQIRANRVMMLAPFFAFPDDLVSRIVPKYPQYFNLVQHGKPYQTLELVAWDMSLAISEFEKRAKVQAEEMDLGERETQAFPPTFKLQYSAGVVPKKKAIAYLEEWQKLPYVSPYEDADQLEVGTPLGDRRMVAFLHELLSLTIEKKVTIEVLNHFHVEFKLPGNLYKAVNRYPGIFYISVKGAVHTLYLREGYQRQQLIEEDHPLHSLKEKFCKLVRNGPRLRSMLNNASRNARYKF
eukprot:c9415_g1_i1 orf=520-1752(-)